MKLKVLFVLTMLICLSGSLLSQTRKSPTSDDRKYWLSHLDRVARPVLENLAADQLKQNMPVVLSARVDNKDHRSKVSYLEALGRTLSGIGPWLNAEGGSKEEQALRNQYRQWTLKGIANAVNPQARDYMLWEGGQPLVDASFFALGLVRCPWLWENLDKQVRQQVQTALLVTRKTVPVYTNWILFSGMIEAFFCKYGMDYDPVRIEFCIREFAEHWYTGDGMYSDGMQFSLDYYNSYVIQPYMSAILEVINQKNGRYNWYNAKFKQITQRYAELQERFIHTDGSFPVTGRSITYRGGAFHHLADMAYRKRLPESLKPSQVRGALTAVIRKTFERPDTFSKSGWLNIGLYGNQPQLGEPYITTGSLYLCTEILLPLGLPPEDEFWSARAEPWTALKVWTGQDVPADHALHVK